MDASWLALLVAIAIVFVFFILVQHWQRVLRRQDWSLRRMMERLGNIESIADPQFLERLSEAAPMPLERVFTLSFRLDDRFWDDVLRATEEEKRFVRDHGSFIGSVKLERWRSHTVATIAEVLPDRKAVGWQTRSLDLYSDPARAGEAFTLWELALGRVGPAAERPPSLELLLRGDSLELLGHLDGRSEVANGHGSGASAAFEDVLLFRVPLDAAQLAPFRSHDPAGSGNGDATSHDLAARANSWQAFYSGCDESAGIEWQLRLRDLTKKSEWERWRILESSALPVVAESK